MRISDWSSDVCSSDLTSSITLSAELGYAKVNGGPTGSNPRSDANGKIHVYRDNAYLTPDTAARMDAAGVTFLPISRVNDEVGSNRTEERRGGNEGVSTGRSRW